VAPISERDRETIDKANRKRADIEIIKGLMAKEYSEAQIAKMMGAPESYVHAMARRYCTS
jgi:hypothetical protein